jgi:hypothetical protein
MRKVIAAFLAAFLCCGQTPVLPGFPSGAFDNKAALDPAGSSACSQYTTFIARTSGTSATEQAAYQAMICGMVSDGTWSLLDTLYIFATNSQTTALLNLVSTSNTGTTHGTVSFTADQGYTGDGSTFYIDTGWQPTDGPNFTQNSAAFGVYALTNAVNGSVQMGQDALANFDAGLKINVSGVTTRAYISAVSSNVLLATNSTENGQFSVLRTSSTATAIYLNGSSIGSSSIDTSGALSAANLYIFANNAGTPGDFASLQMSAAWTGGGMNSTQLLAVQSRINGYMTALGINVY